MKLGSGIFCWMAQERRSGRYGSFFLCDENYEGDVHHDVVVDTKAVGALDGKRVRLTAKVIQSRQSGHVGDNFLKIKPVRPQDSELIEIGVGLFWIDTTPKGDTQMGLKPSDDRKDLWIDPRILYRLHDQTVEITAEETSGPDSPKSDLVADSDGAICVEGNKIQVRTTGQLGEMKNVKVLPSITSLGEGLFVVEPPQITVGHRVAIVQ